MPVDVVRRESDSGVRALALGTMFLCVSANPAIDKRIRMAEFRIGAVNRAKEAIPEPGGKAAHVALALRALGARPRSNGRFSGPWARKPWNFRAGRSGSGGNAREPGDCGSRGCGHRALGIRRSGFRERT